MAIKFSELLDTERLRPFWQRTIAEPLLPAEPRVGQATPAASMDLSGPQLISESPQAVLALLEARLRQELGPSGLLLGHLLHPLRVAVARLDPRVPLPPSHPLQRATSLKLQDLLDRLDDTIHGLLLLRQR